ncbi:Sensor histidine kinase YycG [Sphingobacterium thalpophilum]|uniref:histidine kinase n=2 Tax=Sphingobacterium thalpophilum TaxID=259 RepID=A0A4U9W7J1_9SPHI|nr:Sensor histidine kinase YycG [Sphingobacterium thalpophilum]
MIMANLKSLFILFLLLVGELVCAQPYYFNHYQINEGLSNNAVICSMQDSYGFLWFGTKDGLNRFDGHNFRHFNSSTTEKNSLGGNNIISLREDFNKHIWVGTDQGIYCYNPVDEQFRLLSKEFENADVPVIITDQKQRIWFISNGMLYCHDLIKQITKQITQSDLYITSVSCTKNGNIYFGTPEGKMFQVDKSGRPFLMLDFQLKYGAKDWFSIEKIAENRQGELLIGTSKSGVYTYNLKSRILKSILGPDHVHQFLYVRDILQPNENEYWFATESGLFIYRIDSQTFINIQKERENPWGISDNAVYNILQDKDQGIWIGTYFGGINYYHKNNSIIEKFLPGEQPGRLKGSVVRIIRKDASGHIWIGTENGGLSKLDPLSGNIENYSEKKGNLANNNIHGILPIQDKLLVGSFVNGLDIFDATAKRVTYHIDRNSSVKSDLQSNFLFFIQQTRNGDILAASTRGFYRFDLNTKTFHLISNVPAYMFYTTIWEDKRGNIWLGTWRDGLICYHPRSGYFKHYRHHAADQHSLPNNRINSIFEDSKNQIWVATEGGMAKKLPQGEGFEKIGINEGMPSNVILAFLEDRQNNLWVSTSKGLVRYNILHGKKRIFNLESGLPTVQFNYNSSFNDDAGNFYFGTINGLIRFDPYKLNAINYNTDIPIYITNLQVNNRMIRLDTDSNILSKSILFTDKIQLKHDESSFSLDFAALHYQAPHSIHYSYQMEGLDENWVDINSGQRAYFTKLSPGKYIFTIKAKDPNGNTIPTFARLEIVILPPIWASMPAYICYALIFFGLVAFVFYHFNEKVKQRNRQHLLTVQNHREQELYRSKINFYTDVAHEIRTPLTLIKAPLEKLMDKVEHNPVTDKLLLTMQNNTDKLISLSNQLLDFRKVEAEGFKLRFELENISEIVQDILSNFSITAQAQEKSIQSSITPSIMGYIDAEAFDKICYNLFNNALKYSSKCIEVDLKVDKQKNMLILTVKNDGTLIPPKDRERIFEPFNRSKQNRNVHGSGLGLALTKSLTLKHQGALSYHADELGWNVFNLTLPLNHHTNS